MPEEGVTLSPSPHLLTTPEIVYLSALFVSQGVTKIRLTGGEPTVRKDIVPLMQQIGLLRRGGLRELCLTTNGISLHRKLDAMAEAGLTGVNLSLDTLDPFQFQIMTRRKGFDAVMKSIDRILEMNRMGARIKLKINCVVMRGLNDREIIPFVELCRENPIEIRFIEYMPFDGNKWSQGKMFSYQEMLAVIREKYPSLERVADHKNDTSKTYRIPGFEGRVGFITSMTHNFCGTCNRLRITSDGNLKVCLFGNAEVSLRDIIRKDNDGQPIDEKEIQKLQLLESARRLTKTNDGHISKREQELLDIVGMAVKRKKANHAGMEELKDMKNRPMILIDNMRPLNHILHSRPSLKIPSQLLRPTKLPVNQIRLHHQSRSPSLNKKDEPSASKPQETGTPAATPSPVSPLPSTSDPDLPHLTASHKVHMTQIHDKAMTHRQATATCLVHFSNSRPLAILRGGGGANKKGDVFSVARLAGIIAAKKTPDIVPLCHPGIGLTGVEVDVRLVPPEEGEAGAAADAGACGFAFAFGAMRIVATVSCLGRTGVEMEAMTATVCAALTVYDMLKAVDKGMVIGDAKLVEKKGGRSGHWIREREVGN